MNASHEGFLVLQEQPGRQLELLLVLPAVLHDLVLCRTYDLALSAALSIRSGLQPAAYPAFDQFELLCLRRGPVTLLSITLSLS